MKQLVCKLAIALTICMVIFSGCKPAVPTIKDYVGKSDACYMADKCMSLNAYTESKQDCSLIIQKCMKYVDYEKCCSDKDCYDKIWVKY